MGHFGIPLVNFSTDRHFAISSKPLYTDSLNSWVGHIPSDVEDDMAKIAPMLKTLG